MESTYPPVSIEDRIREELPFLSLAMVIRNKRKFLSCLVTLKITVGINITFIQENVLHKTPIGL